MRRLLLVVLSVVALSASARERNGVTMPDQVTIGGRALRLNGMGLRTKLFFQVYVAGLYLETPTHDAARVIASDQVKSVRMAMLRDLSKKQISEAVEEGFRKNAPAQMPALQQRLTRFLALIPDVKKGEQLVITYLPGQGTIVSGQGEKAVIPGKDFADALFSVWLGRSPVEEGLKKGMLGL